MKPSIAALSSLAIGATAYETPTLVKDQLPDLINRDLKPVQSAIQDLDDKINGLTLAVKSFSGDPTNVGIATGALLVSITQSTKVLSSMSLEQSEYPQLGQVMAPLNEDGKALGAAFKSQKPAFEQAGLCEPILANLTAIIGPTVAVLKPVFDVIAQFTPADQKDGINQLGQLVISEIEKTKEPYGVGNCTSGKGAGGSTGVTALPSSPPTLAPTPPSSSTSTSTTVKPTTSTVRSGAAAGAATMGLGMVALFVGAWCAALF